GGLGHRAGDPHGTNLLGGPASSLLLRHRGRARGGETRQLRHQRLRIHRRLRHADLADDRVHPPLPQRTPGVLRKYEEKGRVLGHLLPLPLRAAGQPPSRR
ncbi:unnamed protein product, partial [Ixodes persulcatus]